MAVQQPVLLPKMSTVMGAVSLSPDKGGMLLPSIFCLKAAYGDTTHFAAALGSRPKYDLRVTKVRRSQYVGQVNKFITASQSTVSFYCRAAAQLLVKSENIADNACR